MEDSDDYEDYDSFPSYRARSHTVTVSQPAQVEREYYYRNKARIAASKGRAHSIRLKKSPIFGRNLTLVNGCLNTMVLIGPSQDFR